MTQDFKEGCEHARDMILSTIEFIKEGCLLEGNRVTANVIDLLYKDLVGRFGNIFEDFKMTV